MKVLATATLVTLVATIWLVARVLGWENPQKLIVLSSVAYALYLLGGLFKNIAKMLISGSYSEYDYRLVEEEKKKENRFHGRESEIHRIKRFLGDPEGGSILIGGRRGSGKTRLVNEALLPGPNLVNIDRFWPGAKYYKKGVSKGVDELPTIFFIPLLVAFLPITLVWRLIRVRRPSRWPKENVKIYLPLIIHGPTEEGAGSGEQNNNGQLNPSEQYRSLILKALAFALVNETGYSRFTKTTLLLNFWSITKLRLQVHKLKKFVDYTSLGSSLTTNLRVSKKPALASAEKIIAGRLDISDARLEMTLMETLKLFHRTNQRLVIVLDELDKLERDDGQSTRITDLMLYLKNIFSQPGVYTIAIANHRQAIPFQQAIAEKEDSHEITLFKDVVILDSLDLHSFRKLVENKIKLAGEIEIDEDDMLTRISVGLGMYTDYIPNELNRVFKQKFARMDSIDGFLKKELGKRYTPEVVRLRQHIDVIHRGLIYAEFRMEGDNPEFNAILHRLLCKAADNLLFGEVSYFSLSSTESILWDKSKLPNDEEITPEQFVLDYDNSSRKYISEKPEAVKDFEVYAGFFREALRRGLYLIVVMLEEEGALKLELHSPEQEVARIIESSVQSGPTLNNASDGPVPTRHKYSPEEQEVVDFINQSKLIYEIFLEKPDSFKNMVRSNPCLPFSLDDQTSKVVFGKYGVKDLSIKWGRLHNLTPTLRDSLINEIIDGLELNNYSYGSSDRLRDLELHIKSNGKRIKLLFKLTEVAYDPKEDGYHKVVVIQDQRSKHSVRGSKKRKVFDISKGYNPVKDYLKELAPEANQP